jgi:hypothetical protein
MSTKTPKVIHTTYLCIKYIEENDSCQSQYVEDNSEKQKS